jgi:hypothetical protein
MEETEAVEFQRRIRRDRLLQINVMLQAKVMALVKMYHRRRLKMELEEVHERMVANPLNSSWRERVLSFFHNS